MKGAKRLIKVFLLSAMLLCLVFITPMTVVASSKLLADKIIQSYQVDDIGVTLRSISDYYIEDTNGEPVAYILTDNGDNLQVVTANTAIRFYSNYAEVWNSTFTNVVVYDDRWIVEYQNKQGKWIEADIYNVTYSYDIVSDDELRVYRAGSSDIGSRTETYIFRAGQSCKIEISQVCNESQTIRYGWKLSGIVADSELPIYDEEVVTGLSYYDSLSDILPFTVGWEDAISTTDTISYLCDVSAQGRKADITFGNFIVSAGATQVLDPTYRSYGQSPGANSASCVIVKPVGLEVGDLMIAQVISAWSLSMGATTAPENWTSIRQDNYDAADYWASALFWKIADATDVAASNFTFTTVGGGSESNRGVITAWYGHDATTPINTNNGQANAPSLTVTSPEITPSVADCMILLFCGIADNNRQSGYAIATSNPAEWTEAYDLPSNLALDLGLSLGYAARPETSATGNGTATTSGGDGNIGQLVAIAPMTASPDITNLPISQDFGPVSESNTYETGLTYFTVTNNSSGAVTITIKAIDFTGGDGWTLSDTATPDANTAGLKAGLEGGDYTIIVKKTETFNTLVSGLAAEGTRKWGFKLYTPTTFSDGVQKSTTVTLTATLD